MIRNALLFLLVSFGSLLGLTTLRPPEVPGRRTLYVVHSDACAPCVQFKTAWTADPAFAGALRRAFNLRSLDWSNIEQRNFASQTLGVDSLPAFVVVDASGRVIRRRYGFAGDDPEFGKRDLIARLGLAPLDSSSMARGPGSGPNDSAAGPNVQAPGPDVSETRPNDSPAPVPAPVRAPDPVRPLVDSEARGRIDELQATQTRIREQLDDVLGPLRRAADAGSVSDVRAEALQKISETLQSQIADISTEIKSLRERPATSSAGPAVVIPDLFPGGLSPVPGPAAGPMTLPDPAAGGGFWSTLVKVGLTLAAPHIGLPLAAVGILSTVGPWLFSRWRKGRAARQARDFQPGAGSGATAGNAGAAKAAEPLPRELDETRELLRLREREGRHPLHDALFGMLAQTELEDLLNDPDSTLAAFAARLQGRIDNRFNQIAPLSTKSKDYVE